jgi:hypothetical protein
MDNAPDDAPDEVVPDEVVAQAKASFARRTRGEIAILTWDSLVDENAPAGDHRLRFDHPDMQIELRLFTAAGNSSDLEGSVKPPVPLHVELEGEQGDVLRSTEATDGVFAFDQIPSGVVRLSVRATTPPIRTDWFRV